MLRNIVTFPLVDYCIKFMTEPGLASAVMPDENAPVGVYRQCLKSYERDIEIMKAQNRELQAKLNKSLQPQLEKEQKFRDLEQQCKQMAREIFELRAERADLSSQLEDRSLQLSIVNGSPHKHFSTDLESQLSAMKMLNSDLVEDQKRIRKQYKKNEQLRDATIEKYQILREKYETLKRCHLKQSSDMKTLLEERSRQESLQIKIMEKQITKNKEIDTLTEENRVLKDRIHKLEETKILKSDYDKLMRKYNKLRSKQSEMETRNTELAKENGLLNVAIQKLNNRYNKMKTSVRTSEEQHKETETYLRKQLNDKTEEITALQNSMNSQSSKIELLEEQNSEMNSRILQQLKDIIQLREASEQSVSEANEMKEMIAAIRNEKTKLESEYCQQATDLYDRIVNLQNRMKNKSEESHQLQLIKKEKAVLQQQVKTLNSRITELESELTETRSNVDHLISELHNSEDMISSIVGSSQNVSIDLE